MPKIDGIEVAEGNTVWLDPRLICKGIYKVITEKQAKKIAAKSKQNGIYEVSQAHTRDRPLVLTRVALTRKIKIFKKLLQKLFPNLYLEEAQGRYLKSLLEKPLPFRAHLIIALNEKDEKGFTYFEYIMESDQSFAARLQGKSDKIAEYYSYFEKQYFSPEEAEKRQEEAFKIRDLEESCNQS